MNGHLILRTFKTLSQSHCRPWISQHLHCNVFGEYIFLLVARLICYCLHCTHCDHMSSGRSGFFRVKSKCCYCYAGSCVTFLWGCKLLTYFPCSLPYLTCFPPGGCVCKMGGARKDKGSNSRHLGIGGQAGENTT